jgi:hypothetical protein
MRCLGELRQVAAENVILHQEQGSLPEPRHTVVAVLLEDRER